MSSKEFTGGLLLGAALGITAGILLAPDKGSETVKKISTAAKDKFNQLRGRAENMANGALDEVKSLTDEGTTAAKELLREGRDRADEFKSRGNTDFS